MFPKKIQVVFLHVSQRGRQDGREEEGVSPQDSQGESREERDCSSPEDFSDGISGC